MDNDKLILILCILVGILYLKWILIILFFPFQIFFAQYQKHKSNKLWKILAIPYWLFDSLLLRSGWTRFMLYQVSTLPSNHVRKAIYRALGAEISSDVIIHFKTEIRSIQRLTIGKGTIIGDNVLLDARNVIQLGSNVNISSNVSIYTEQHNHRDPEFRCNHGGNKRVIVGDRVWLGSNVTVLPGVKIGEGAVCCAGCVVTKDVEPYTVIAGIPAKKVGERPRNLTYQFNGKSCRFY